MRNVTMSSRRTSNAPSAQQAAPAVLSSYAAPAPTPVASASPDAKFTVHDVMAVAGMVADFMNDVEARSKLREEKEAMISELADNGYDLSTDIGAFGFGHDDEDDDLDHLTSMIAARLGVPTEEISVKVPKFLKSAGSMMARGAKKAKRFAEMKKLKLELADRERCERITGTKTIQQIKDRLAELQKNIRDEKAAATKRSLSKKKAKLVKQLSDTEERLEGEASEDEGMDA